MSALPTLVAATGLLLAFAGDAVGHAGFRTFPIIELTDEDLGLIDIHDGSVDDWLTLMEEPSLTALDFGSGSAGTTYDPASLDWRV